MSGGRSGRGQRERLRGRIADARGLDVVLPEGEVRSWTTSNTSIAEVDAATGALTGVASGSARISATHLGQTARAAVEVYEIVDGGSTWGVLCVLTRRGTVRCWGNGDQSHIGYGRGRLGRLQGPEVGDLPIGGRATALFLQSQFACALLDAGEMQCWGSADRGSLGHGRGSAPWANIGDDETPEDAGPVPVGGRVAAIGGGDFRACAVLGDGALRCWGDNVAGQLGYGPAVSDVLVGDDETPADVGNVPVGGPVVQVVGGRLWTCALMETGSVRCWGINSETWDPETRETGQNYGLGYGRAHGFRSPIGDDETPEEVGDLPLPGRAAKLAGGGYHACALMDDGAVRCWGFNGFGALGHGLGFGQHIGDDETAARTVPLRFPGAVVDITAGYFHTCALLETGDVYCWGLPDRGRLGYGNDERIGDNETAASAGPVPLPGPAERLIGGIYATCAVLRSGPLVCWGSSFDLAFNREDIGDDETPADVDPVRVFPGPVPPYRIGGIESDVGSGDRGRQLPAARAAAFRWPPPRPACGFGGARRRRGCGGRYGQRRASPPGSPGRRERRPPSERGRRTVGPRHRRESVTRRGRPRVRIRLIVGLAASAGLATCGGDAGTGPRSPTQPPPPPPPAAAASIAIEPASATLSWIGDAERFAATILDRNGNTIEGTVDWSSRDAGVVAINEGGEATAVAEGATVVRATFRGVTASADVTVEQVPASINVVAGDGQSGLMEAPLAELVIVMVADSGGHAVADEMVAFTPAEGSGTVTADTATTNAGGFASTVWTLGAREGAQVLNVQAAGGPAAATVAATAVGPPLFSFSEIVIPRLDTTVVLPTHEHYGNSWTFEATESRWLREHAVATVTRRASPPGLVLNVANPGSLVIEANVGAVQKVLVRVAPSEPVVYDVRQEAWPREDDVTLRGYAVDRIPLPLLQVDGEPVLRATGDSAGIVLGLPPAAGGECSGSHVSRGALSVLGAELRQGVGLPVNRLKGPVVDPVVGEAATPRGRRPLYPAAGAERCPVRAGGRRPHLHRRGGCRGGAQSVQRRRSVPLEHGGQQRRGGRCVRGGAGLDRGAAGGRARGIRRRDPPVVGTGPGLPLGGRKGGEPTTRGGKISSNTATATAGSAPGGSWGSMSRMWCWPCSWTTWKRSGSTSPPVRPRWIPCSTTSRRPRSRTCTGRSLARSRPEPAARPGNSWCCIRSGFSATGRADPNVDGDPRLVVLRMGHAPWGDENGWYTDLMSHEFAHAWQFYNYKHFAANWSGEGIANLFADEETRISAGLPLDANHDVRTPLRLFRLRLPVSWRLCQPDTARVIRTCDTCSRTLINVSTAGLMTSRSTEDHQGDRRGLARHPLRQVGRVEHLRAQSRPDEPNEGGHPRLGSSRVASRLDDRLRAR